MELILLATAAITSIIFLTIFLSLLREIRTKSFNSKEIPLVVLALTYLVFTITLILWSLNFFTFNLEDLLIIFSIALFVQTACLITVLCKTYQNKKIFYTLLPFTLLVPAVVFFPSIFHLAIPLSLFITLLSFLYTTSTHDSSTRYLILYTSTSLFLYLFATLWQNIAKSAVFVSLVLFLPFLIYFLKFLKQGSGQNFPIPQEQASPLIHFLKHFVFIIIITNFVFVGTVSVHEFGHLVASSQSGCEEVKIIYELNGLPHTEVNCDDINQKNKWTLGGILLPFIVALLLFLSGGKFIKELALQIAGFNLIISYLDIASLNLSEAITVTSLIAGVTLTIFSLALLVRSRVE